MSSPRAPAGHTPRGGVQLPLRVSQAAHPVEPELDDGEQEMDEEAYFIVLRRHLRGGTPIIRVEHGLAVIVLPTLEGDVMRWDRTGCVSVRVQYVGDLPRPSLTWACSCADYATYRDHCRHGDLHMFRQYGGFA